MLLDFNKLVGKYNLKINGVIHIGAHYGTEHKIYEQNKIKNIIYFEPLSKNFQVLKENVSNSILYNLALGNFNGEIEMFVEDSNQGMSSSILKPKLHLEQYPHITFPRKEKVQIRKLDSLNLDMKNYNLINIDVQGYELEVFKGGRKSLSNIDYIISEINRDELYSNCVQITELSEFLKEYGFELVEESWDGKTWGDGFFIKNK